MPGPFVRDYRAGDEAGVAFVCERSAYSMPPEDCLSLLSTISALPYLALECVARAPEPVICNGSRCCSKGLNTPSFWTTAMGP